MNFQKLKEIESELNDRYSDYLSEPCRIVDKENGSQELTAIAISKTIQHFCHILRDDLGFTQCMDLCAVDYSEYKNGDYQGRRFAVVIHLLNIKDNLRLRVRYFADSDDFPIVPSIIDIWDSVNWYEREAFDLYGIIFEGHPDLRRILTDYGFIGHPFRKDFPISGYAEMRYDPIQERVIYQPVTIESRSLTPRIIREENYGKIKA